MQQGPSVTPELVWNAVTGFQHSAAMKAAVDLEIFTHIGAGAKTAAAIAKAADASEP